MPNIVFVLLRRMQAPLIVLILVYAAAVLGFVLIPGQDAQGAPWRMGFFHAFYVVSYTATTIGFGELPYPFTEAQRLWMIATVYLTVVAWMYTIGVLFALIQDPSFRALVRQIAFSRAVRRIVEPFYIVCGYGDTGSSVVRGLTDAGLRAVVVDRNPDRISALLLDDLKSPVPGLCADAGRPDNLIIAGMKSRYCAGILALTDIDQTNLQVTITAKLLRPGLLAIARAHTANNAENIRAAGADHVLNPFMLAARIIGNAVHAPSMYVLDERLTSVPHEPWSPPLNPPRGNWILCGYGRFGKAMHEALLGEGVHCTIVEADTRIANDVPGCIVGIGTAAETLRDANIRTADAIIAGTDNDANNLSIVINARALNPNIFVVARQVHRDNEENFSAARIPIVMQFGRILAGEVFSIVTSPLIVDFLRLSQDKDERWASELRVRIREMMGEHNPDRWAIDVRSHTAPALSLAVSADVSVAVGALRRDPSRRDEQLPSIPLLLKRGTEFTMLPKETEVLQKGDQVLFCGPKQSRTRMQNTVRNPNTLHYVLTGEDRTSRFLDRIAVR
jgi:Trk K+ transport system NAD-binding subunit